MQATLRMQKCSFATVRARACYSRGNLRNRGLEGNKEYTVL